MSAFDIALPPPVTVTHPDVSTVAWHDHRNSWRLTTGCTRADCGNGTTSAAIPPGPLYKCWGPLELPLSSGKVHRFLPEVDMTLVHHMILFGSQSCGGPMLYAWARTGQTSPIGLDLDTWDAAAGYGYVIGKGRMTHVSLQIHYQQSSKVPTVDRSGLRIWMSPTPALQPVNLVINMLVPRIPAHEVVDNCVVCNVTRGGRVFGWRNHAHKLGRDIWSDWIARDGTPHTEPFGLISSQHPQIIRRFPTPQTLEAGEVLQLHCVYDNKDSWRPSGYGSDENGEMCNQYLLAEPGLSFRCIRGGFGASQSGSCQESPHVYVDDKGTARPKTRTAHGGSGHVGQGATKKPM
tara:strand:- start:1107 stop:2150 length:1044 start_codon:yes stop_codon:yes gene_type:complete